MAIERILTDVRPPASGIGFVGGLIGLGGGLLALVLAVSLYAYVNGLAHVPRAIEVNTRSDNLRYPFHAFLGAALNYFDSAPRSAALQWLRAAAHARSAADLDQAAQGMSAAMRRMSSPTQLASEMCDLTGRRYPDPRMAAALERAGIDCVSGSRLIQ